MFFFFYPFIKNKYFSNIAKITFGKSADCLIIRKLVSSKENSPRNVRKVFLSRELQRFFVNP